MGIFILPQVAKTFKNRKESNLPEKAKQRTT